MEDVEYTFHTGGLYSLKDKAQDKGLNNAQDIGNFRKAGTISEQTDHQVVRQHPLCLLGD